MAIDFSALNSACQVYYSMDNEDVSGSTIVDLTPNNNDGTITGATTGVTGILNEAFSFDGSNDYVDYGAPRIPLATDFTYSLWFYAHTVTPASTMISQHSFGTGRMLHYLQNGNLIYAQDGTTGMIYSSISPNQWYHLVVTREGTNFKMYLNGVEVDTMTSSQSFQNTNTQLGVYNTVNGNFDGLIDEASIFSISLNQAEINYLYNSGAPTTNQQYPFTGNTQLKKPLILGGNL